MATQEPYGLAKSDPGTSTIGQDLIITGDVTSNSALAIDGHIRGDVRCASLILGESSEVEGNVVAEDVVIRGRVIGSIRVCESYCSLPVTWKETWCTQVWQWSKALTSKVNRAGQRTHWLKTTSDRKLPRWSSMKQPMPRQKPQSVSFVY